MKSSTASQAPTSKTPPSQQDYPHLLRKLDIGHANQLWALDTTHIPIARGFVYLTAVPIEQQPED